MGLQECAHVGGPLVQHGQVAHHQGDGLQRSSVCEPASQTCCLERAEQYPTGLLSASMYMHLESFQCAMCIRSNSQREAKKHHSPGTSPQLAHHPNSRL